MSYTVTSNMYLRNLYGANKDYISGSIRSQAPNAKVVSADSQALSKGVKTINAFEFGTRSKDDDLDDALLSNNLKAFIDAYNNTIDSASDSPLKDIKRLVSKLKDLGDDYKEELGKLGISFDDNGYMSIESAAVANLDNSKFEKMFGKDSDFTKTVRTLARKLYRHIDASV